MNKMITGFTFGTLVFFMPPTLVLCVASIWLSIPYLILIGIVLYPISWGFYSILYKKHKKDSND